MTIPAALDPNASTADPSQLPTVQPAVPMTTARGILLRTPLVIPTRAASTLLLKKALKYYAIGFSIGLALIITLEFLEVC